LNDVSPSDEEPELVPAAPVAPDGDIDPSAYYAPKKRKIARASTEKKR
jgi:hypothetical protein